MKKTNEKKIFVTFVLLVIIIGTIMKVQQNNDIRAILISILSLIYGFVNDFLDKIKEDKYNKKSFMSDFFKELYFKKITVDMPSLLSKYNNAVSNTEKSDVLSDLDTLIVDILDSSMFYKYYDSDFYEGVKKSVMDIQDEIFKVKESITNNLYRIGATDQNLNQTISDFYEIMIKYYSVED